MRRTICNVDSPKASGGGTFKFIFSLSLWASLALGIKCPTARLSDVVLDLPGHLALVAGADWRIPGDLRAKVLAAEPLSLREIQRLKRWAHDEVLAPMIEGYVARAKRPEGSRMRKFTLFPQFYGEGMLAHSDYVALRLMAEDVGFFSPGHGTPGGKDHVLRVFAEQTEESKSNRFRMSIDVAELQKVYADLPGTRTSRVIFYSSCSAGLPGVDGTPSNAATLAKSSGRPVIAPMGELTGVPRGDGSLRVRVEGRSAEDAFALYQPDGSSRIVGFDEFRAMVFRTGAAQERVTYLEQ